MIRRWRRCLHQGGWGSLGGLSGQYSVVGERTVFRPEDDFWIYCCCDGAFSLKHLRGLLGSPLPPATTPFFRPGGL